jgi:hypothetical protein
VLVISFVSFFVLLITFDLARNWPCTCIHCLAGYFLVGSNFNDLLRLAAYGVDEVTSTNLCKITSGSGVETAAFPKKGRGLASISVCKQPSWKSDNDKYVASVTVLQPVAAVANK